MGLLARGNGELGAARFVIDREEVSLLYKARGVYVYMYVYEEIETGSIYSLCICVCRRARRRLRFLQQPVQAIDGGFKLNERFILELRALVICRCKYIHARNYGL